MDCCETDKSVRYKTGKNEVAIAALPGDFQIYRFTIPIKPNGDYKDFPEFDEIQAITTLMELTMDIRETQLVGKQEWMQQWDSNHERLNLGKIESPYSADIRSNYFQNVTEKNGDRWGTRKRSRRLYCRSEIKTLRISSSMNSRKSLNTTPVGSLVWTPMSCKNQR
jgi:hypothetical protein